MLSSGRQDFVTTLAQKHFDDADEMPLVRTRSKSMSGSISLANNEHADKLNQISSAACSSMKINSSSEQSSTVRATGSSNKQTRANDDESASSIQISSYGEAHSECELNDSRFNDISSISGTDRINDEKDSRSNTSGRFDVSAKENLTLCSSVSDTKKQTKPNGLPSHGSHDSNIEESAHSDT